MKVRTKITALLALLLLCSLSELSVFAQELEEEQKELEKKMNLTEKKNGEESYFFYPTKLVYIHGGTNLFLGGNLNRSSDVFKQIRKLYPGFKSPSLDGAGTLYLKLGIRNIFQIERRWSSVTKTFSSDEVVGYRDYPNLGIAPVYDEFEYDANYREWLFKFNPLFWEKPTGGEGIYLTYGFGKVDCVKSDHTEEGFFDGKETIYGIEFEVECRALSAGIALERRTIVFPSFQKTKSNVLIRDFQHTEYLLELRIGIGIGY